MAKSADTRIQERRAARRKGRLQASRARFVKVEDAKTATVQFISGRYYDINGVELHPGSVSVLAIEEASEIIKDYAKATRFGWENPDPDTGISNKLLFMTELGQLAAVTKMLLDMIPGDAVERRVFDTAMEEKLRRHMKDG